MKKQSMKKGALAGLVAALALTASAASYAGSTTGNVTLSGTLTPQPPNCSVVSMASFDFSGTVSAGQMVSTKSIALNCTSGTAYSISTTADWNGVNIGSYGATAQVREWNGSPSLFAAPVARTGTGASDTFPLTVVLGGATPNSNLNPAIHVGAVSGTIPLTIAW